MYNRRVLIFSTQDVSVAGGNLCGMAKFSVTEGQTQVCVFVSNVQVVDENQWWGVALVDGKMYKSRLPHLANFCFYLPTTALENVAFLLVKVQGGKAVVVADSYLGNRQINDFDRGKLQGFLLDECTHYENFVSSTDNFYTQQVKVDVDKLKQQSRQNYQALQNYSSAFERYYATGRGDNYLLSVKTELEELFKRFPPYYPLMEKYKESYFARIDFPQSDKYFVVGLITQDGQAKYICYALPGTSESLCDKDFTFVQKDDKGFWMLCQDAENGQITTLQV